MSGEPPAPPPHSWRARSLVAIASGEPPPAPSIGGLAYPDINLWSGEPGEGKTMAAYIAGCTEIHDGRTVMIVDFEMGAPVALERLRSLGLTDDEIHRHVIYVAPDEPLATEELRRSLDGLLELRQPSVAIVDALAGLFGVHGWDPNSEADTEKARGLLDRFVRHGCAVIAIDHVVKNRAERGRFSSGSQRKLGIAAAHLGIETIKPIGKGRTGLLKFRVHKDRHGSLPRPIATELEITSDADGQITWEYRDHAGDDHAPTTFRPTALMEKASRHLEALTQPASRNTIEREVGGKRDPLRLALDLLTREGYVTETAGERRARLLTSARPYRQTDETPALRPDFAPTSPRGEVDDFAPRPSPIGGGEVDVVTAELERLHFAHADIAAASVSPSSSTRSSQTTEVWS